MIDQNYLEGFRVVFSIVLLFTAMFAIVNSRQGELVIPRPARSRITWRRRFQMACTALVSIILGAQSMYVTQIPNSENPSFAAITSNWSLIFTLVILITMVLVHIIGWWKEGTIMKVPLDPDSIERSEGSIIRGRNIAHNAKSVYSVCLLAMEPLIEDTKISTYKRNNLKLAIDSIQLSSEQIDAWHDEIKMLQLEIPMNDETNLES